MKKTNVICALFKLSFFKGRDKTQLCNVTYMKYYKKKRRKMIFLHQNVTYKDAGMEKEILNVLSKVSER